jgi:hypothetical protein
LWLVPGPNVTHRGFFQEGDHRDEVASLQGTPAEILIARFNDSEVWIFPGGSSVKFSVSTGLVTGWEDKDGSLGVASNTGVGNWETITDEFNPETRTRDVVIFTEDFMNEASRLLFVRFQNGKFDIFIDWGSEVSYTGDALVRWCFDSGEWLQCLWGVSEDRTATFVPETEWAAFLAFTEAEVLLVGTNTAGGDDLYACFSVSGFSNAMGPVLEAWGQSNNWSTVGDEYNPRTRTRDVTIVTRDPAQYDYSLMVRVRNGELDIFVNWRTEITYSDRTQVRWKIDNGPWRRRSCGVSTDNEATFMPDKEIKDLIRGLSNAEVFSVRVNPFGGNPITATFQVGGFASAVEPVLEAWRQAGRP